MAAFKEEQRPDCSNAASHVITAVLAHVARSGRSDAALRRKYDRTISKLIQNLLIPLKYKFVSVTLVRELLFWAMQSLLF